MADLPIIDAEFVEVRPAPDRRRARRDDAVPETFSVLRPTDEDDDGCPHCGRDTRCEHQEDK
jgi:hypothetical protein